MTTARYCFHPHEDPRCTQVTKCSLTDLNYDSCCIVTCCCPKSLTFFVRLILKALLILCDAFFSSLTRYRGCDLKSLPFLTSNCNHVHNPYTFCNLKTDHISFLPTKRSRLPRKTTKRNDHNQMTEIGVAAETSEKTLKRKK